MAELHVEIVRPTGPHARVDLCCVIDVMRATTTAAVLATRFEKLVVARSATELDALPGSAYTVFSELTTLVTNLPRHDNSPAIARTVELGSRTPVLITTNGTIAVDLAAGFAREVVLASFVNLSAVIAYVRARGAKTIAVLPAGNIARSERTIEDDRCADAIAHRLRGLPFDEPAAVAEIKADARVIRRSTAPGLAADLEICFAIDAVPVVPVVSRVSAGWCEVQPGQNVAGTLR